VRFGIQVPSRMLLAVQIKFYFCARASLAIADLHLFELPDAIDLLDLFGIELLQKFVPSILSFGVNHDDIFGPIDSYPGADSRIASSRTWMRIGALQDITGKPLSHLLF